MRYSLPALALVSTLLASSGFAKTYKAIKVYGADSLGEKSVLYYSKLKAGQDLSSADLRRAVLALHKSGLFADISISEQKNTLIIKVVEQPVISKIAFAGTDHMPKSQFLDALKSQGVAVGRVFDPKTVYQIKPMLEQTLATMGYEKAVVAINYRHSSKKSIVLEITVDEGQAKLISEISYIGNHTFSDRLLNSKIELAPRIWSFISGNNKFSKFALAKDLQAIEKFYQSQGYAQARASLASNTTVDGKLKLAIKVNEGAYYTISGFSLNGFKKHDYHAATDLLVNGAAYNVVDVEHARLELEHALGSLGYAFAKVSYRPLLSGNKVKVHFTANLGPKVQIRHINFSGQTATQDEVLRREMQQTELAQYNYTLVRESERRLRNLGFLSSVTCKPVKQNGFVDLNCDVAEGNASSLIASIGYSPQSGVTYKIDVVNDNFIGSGKKLGVNLEKSDVQTYAKISMTQPFIFGTEFSNTWSIDAVKLKNVKDDSSKYQSNHVGLYNDFGMPLREHSFFSFGLGLKNVNILSYDPGVDHIDAFITKHGKHFGILDAHFGLKYYDLDQSIFPTAGTSSLLRVATSLPFKDSTVKFYKIDFNNSTYLPLGHNLTLNYLMQLGYGRGYGGDSFPFFNNYMAGGEGSVRGFETSSLGPKDNKDKPMGGNVFAATSVNLYLPQALGEDMRYGFFVDAGNVFQDSVDLHDLRASAGLVLHWRTPMGPMSFSYGIPFVKKTGDKIQNFSVNMMTGL